ncbi:GNAT family N-acetyltransferase [Segetibacter sp.]|jgi:N-acetylglutamate synthase-like GNAT family acetyltransferase|uniref:GNAT family N-acetyltransferase n=1 Tax=Segetibacter sp. TaxID=2231182 RepID=UPI00261CC4E6|nr:GNAT family N-acetyltransferase [Segetibacter sp.]MCW3081348.1 GCN5-related N-acetyltransferase [Segetibacter sp.]
MPLKIIDHNSKEYNQMVELRKQILRKPLGLDFSKEDLEKEKEDLLIAAYEDDQMLGCCILTQIDPTAVRLRQMAVKAGLQGKGIGRVLMQFAENIARDRGYKKVCMHARKSAAGFYERLGYAISGEEFTEVTIPHYNMEKQL